MHALDLSRLQRRKPDNSNVVALRYDWKLSTYGTHYWWAGDPKHYNVEHRGQIRLRHIQGNEYECGLTSWTVWEDGWDSTPSVRIWLPFQAQTVELAKHQCELLYNMHMVPLLLNYTYEKERELESLNTNRRTQCD